MDSVFACVLYHAAFAVMAFAASCTPVLESALQETVFGIVAFIVLDRASSIFASFTLFLSVFAASAADPFRSVFQSFVAVRRRSDAAAQSALASAMRRSACAFQTMPPAVSSASTTTVMTMALLRCGFFVFFSVDSAETSMVSSSMAFSFSVICSPCS